MERKIVEFRTCAMCVFETHVMVIADDQFGKCEVLFRSNNEQDALEFIKNREMFEITGLAHNFDCAETMNAQFQSSATE